MLYYSHVNEDNRIERNLLQSSGCATVVAVAGSGERIISLLDIPACSEFHAVDVNIEALYLLELKLAALVNLDTEEYLLFIGHAIASGKQRQCWFDLVKKILTLSCHDYWTENLDSIKKGILNMGHFEKFLSRVRKPTRLFLGKGFQNVFDNPGDLKKFPHRRWRIINYLFSRRWIYKVWGNKDLAFIGNGADSRMIPSALNNLISTGHGHQSFIMHLVFEGHLRGMNDKDLPPSLNKSILNRVRQRLINKQINISYHHSDILSFVKENHQRLAQHVFYSLSDILSFENKRYLEEVLHLSSIPGNTVVWRAFLRNRLRHDDQASMVSRDNENYKDHTISESTGMYQVFSLSESLVYEQAAI